MKESKQICVMLAAALAVAFFLVAPTALAGPMVGNDKDEHGCIGSAGYQWCEAKQKCLRSWEEKCEVINSTNSSSSSSSSAASSASASADSDDHDDDHDDDKDDHHHHDKKEKKVVVVKLPATGSNISGLVIMSIASIIATFGIIFSIKKLHDRKLAK